MTMMTDRDSDTTEYDLETFSSTEPEAEAGADTDDFLQDRALSAELVERKQKGAFIVRTSDRISYRRCRRKWKWSYSGGRNLRPRSEASPLWLGSGFHYALEDFHGYRHYEHARDALKDYATATGKSGLELPYDQQELLDLGQGMLDYYEGWLETRDPMQTLWVDGKPQVEVSFYIEIPKEHLIPFVSEEILSQYTEFLYSVTIDRIAIDSHGRLWILEYKSAKSYIWHHFDTDPQISAYVWGANLYYPNHEIAGVVYQQHIKRVPKPPDFLSSTGMFSISKRQKTTYAMYRQSLRSLYGSDLSKWPLPNKMFLQYLVEKESQDSDDMVKRDFVSRTLVQCQSEYQKILWEMAEMMNPTIHPYPNPTRDCKWDCSFMLPCTHLDLGADYEGELSANYISRTSSETRWQHLLTNTKANPKGTL